jgi:heme-degrading monooxygenase HmoA
VTQRPARTPEPPYVAVIFTSLRASGDHGYGAMSDRMVELAAQQPGFLGVESVREGGGLGITVSYWRSLEDVVAWRRHPEHLCAQRDGRRIWYREYQLRICEVTRTNEYLRVGDSK